MSLQIRGLTLKYDVRISLMAVEAAQLDCGVALQGPC